MEYTGLEDTQEEEPTHRNIYEEKSNMRQREASNHLRNY